MIKHLFTCAVVISCASLPVSYAEQIDRGSRSAAVNQAIPQQLKVPGTDFEVDWGALGRQSVGTPPPRELLKAIATWLSANFDLPANDSYPTIKFATATTITTLRYTGVLSEKPQDIAAVPPGQREVVAVYDALTNTIYLFKGWTGSTPAELSMLVHEMVHHLQNMAHIKYECAQAKEELAYAAQEKWLGMFGRNLTTEFEVDPFTLLVSARCIY